MSDTGSVNDDKVDVIVIEEKILEMEDNCGAEHNQDNINEKILDNQNTIEINENTNWINDDNLNFNIEDGEWEFLEENSENFDNSFQVNNINDDIEDGEIKDKEERPKTKAICRFYIRGNCLRGEKCKYLHPGEQEKIKYQNFNNTNINYPNCFVPYNELGDYFSYYQPAPYRNYNNYVDHNCRILELNTSLNSNKSIHKVPPMDEDSWERNLRETKQIILNASKNKEQDIEGDDQKKYLALYSHNSVDENFNRRDNESISASYQQKEQFYTSYDSYNQKYHRNQQRQRSISPYDEKYRYRPSGSYRELPPDKMPKYDEKNRARPTREVIIQRDQSTRRFDQFERKPAYEKYKKTIEKRSRSSHSVLSNRRYIKKEKVDKKIYKDENKRYIVRSSYSSSSDCDASSCKFSHSSSSSSSGHNVTKVKRQRVRRVSDKFIAKPIIKQEKPSTSSSSSSSTSSPSPSLSKKKSSKQRKNITRI